MPTVTKMTASVNKYSRAENDNLLIPSTPLDLLCFTRKNDRMQSKADCSLGCDERGRRCQADLAAAPPASANSPGTFDASVSQ